jgi:hypothetical protein
MQGIDALIGAPVPASAWTVLRDNCYRFFVAVGWGGRTRNSLAAQQLQDARAAGLLTAGYCFLNFDRPQNGACQVQEALAAFGPEAAFLGFLAIDVEDAFLPAGLQPPQDPVAQRAAVQRIAEAVAEVRAVGLKPAIYTTGRYWNPITGDSTAFKDIPLWRTQDDGIPDPAIPGAPFGGWGTRAAKQYRIDTSIASFPASDVDLDVAEPSLFRCRNPRYSPGLRLTISREGPSIVICWSAAVPIQLQVADSPAGPWANVTVSSNPFTISDPSSKKFYRPAP